MIQYILITLYVLACFILILFVLLQPGKADAAAIFGGGASSTAFGPRGTQTVLAKVTVGAAVVFFLLAFLFSIPGLFEKKSLGQTIKPGQAKSAPAQPAPVPPTVPQSSTAPAAANQPAGGAGNSAAGGNASKPAESGNGAKK